eukprot:941564-Alexandrium_andersonii.AAC.2
MPVELKEHLAKDKNDLFNVWLNNSKNLHSCIMVYQKRYAKKLSSKASQGTQGVSEGPLGGVV